jgi:simple sugar transport system substrate-binding protein
MNRIKMLVIIAILVFGIIQTSCCVKNEKTNHTTKPLRFVFITTCVDEDFFIPVKKGMEQAASLLGVECSFIGTKGVDVNQQATMVSEAIKQEVNGIALNIIDTLGFDSVVMEAIDKGIPVVAFNVDDNKTPNARLSGICQNLYKAGYDLGHKISAQIPENSSVLMTLHSEGISALNDRLKGEQDALKKKNIKWKVVVTGIYADSAAIVIANALNNNPGIRVILCTGQADTEGAGLAIEKNFSNLGYLAAGFDLSPEIIRLIKNDHILFTIDQQPYMQGFYPVVQLYQYCHYGILPSNTEIVASFVTKKNIDDIEKLCKEHFR